eukprot:m.66232 g.66232  ORF g.66232 m.66232 type:complete len:547 (-) comp9806_c0_seq1:120-1760(-)
MGKGKGGAGKAELQHLLSESDNARKTAASPDRSPTIVRYGLGQRHALAFLAFFGFFMVYALRVNLSVAILKMKTEFQWNSASQSLVLSSFFFGYLFSQIPGGYLAGKYGAKTVFGIGVFATTALTLLTPVVAETKHLWLLVTLRILEGFGEGVTYPAMMAMWARWAPPLERTKLATSGFVGSYAGTIVGLPLSYFLIGTNIPGMPGWQSVFYILGMIGLVWAAAWWWFIYDTPESHPYITAAERKYITSAIKSQQVGTQYAAVPWGKLARSIPLYAVIVSHVCNNWAFYALLTGLSTYLHSGVGVATDQGGLDACLPYIAIFLTAFGSGRVADWLRDTMQYPTGMVRKAFNTVSFIIAGTFLMFTGVSKDVGTYVGVSHRFASVACITIAQGGLGLSFGGWGVNHLDIGPRYAGVLMGITNSVATIPGFVAPEVTGIIVSCNVCDKDGLAKGYHFRGPSPCPPHLALGPNNTFVNVTAGFTQCSDADVESEWKTVFFISAGLCFVGAAFYAVCGSGKVQSWNTPEGLEEEDDELIDGSIQTGASTA